MAYEKAKIWLEKNQYYPLFLEYFNWGGGAEFQFIIPVKLVKVILIDISVITNCSSRIIYPSRSTSPGEYAETTFAGASGESFPTEPGDYYVLYKGTNINGANVVSGSYGPFTVPSSAEVTISKKAVYSDGTLVTDVRASKPFDIEYTIEPKDIVPNAILNSLNPVELINVRIQDSLTEGFTVTKNAIAGEFSFPDTSEKNKYTWIIPGIRYNLVTLDDGTEVYRSEESVYTFKVGVELKASDSVGESIQISKDKLSILTYEDPSNGAKVSQEFNNGTVALKEDMIVLRGKKRYW